MSDLTHVFLAGYDNSGPEHWQRLWYNATPGSYWVEHSQWDVAMRSIWVADLEAALQSIPGRKLVIAHSLGCLLLAEWAIEHSDAGLAGAMLVAPPDPAGFWFPQLATGFRSPFETSLPCPSLIVASRDDPYASFEYAAALSGFWQADLVDVGELGHINADSALGDWQAGKDMLAAFAARLA